MRRSGKWLLVLVGGIGFLPHLPVHGQIIQVAGPSKAPAMPSQASSLRVDGAGDPFPEGALRRLGTVRLRHGGPVQVVALSPDGKFLASASADGAVRIWDPATGRELRLIYRPAGPAAALAFAPDGKSLATTGSNGMIQLADPATGGTLRHLFGAHRGTVRCLAFAPDGKQLAVATSDRLIGILDVTRGPVKYLEGHGEGVHSVAWSPDGKTLASAGGDGTVRLWDPAQNRQTVKIDAHAGNVTVVAFAPDGKTLASAGGTADKPDPRIRLWDAATGKEKRSLPGPAGGVRALAFTPDGQTLVSSGGDDSVRLWDLAAGKEMRQFKGHAGVVVSMALSRDGKTLVTGSDDHTIRIWETATGKDLCPVPGYQHEVNGVAFSPDGKTLAGASLDHTLRLWDVSTGREVRRYGNSPSAVCAVAFSADGKTLASTGRDGAVRLWESLTGRESRSLPLEPAPSWGWSVTLTPDGALVAAGSGTPSAAEQPGAVNIWETATGKLVRRFTHAHAVTTVAFSPDGTTLAWGGQDAPLALWEIGKDRPRILAMSGALECLAFAPDGRVLACGNSGGSVELCETATGKVIRTLAEPASVVQAFRPGPPSPTEVRGIAFSPDGKTLAAGHGTTVRLWEVHTGQTRGVFSGHQGAIAACAFAPDGRSVATASADTTILIWDVTGTTASATPFDQLLPYIESSRPASISGPDQPKPAAQASLETLWTDLGGADAVKAYQARWALAAVPKAVRPLLQQNLKAVPHLDAARLERLLADLDADFLVRERASAELDRLGAVVEAELRRLLVSTSSAEVFKRVKTLLDKLGPAGSTERIRDLRALEVLEATNSPEGRRLLEELARGEPRAQLTQEARAALARLAQRPGSRP
jgi:WD40 repeat protein